jgi:hypothetical protein
MRPLDIPFPVRVRADREGRPLEILRSGREDRRIWGSVRAGRVATIREVWRIDDEWWRHPISRLYHEVVLENGRILILYFDLLEGGWWAQ